MDDRLHARDYRFVLICFAVCAASLWVGVHYFYRAFPEASIDFQVTKDASLPIAERFLAAQGISTGTYRHAAVFRYDDETKVFLERELGLERANALMGRDLKLWRWGHRWFKPLQKEEIRAEVTTRGEIASFDHSLAEDAPGADLPAESARAIAESFLALEIRQPLDKLVFIDSQTQKRPRRTDHLFTWKVAGMDLRNASYRVSVTVQGDRVDGYNEFLKIPEEWSRDYARLRSLNESATQVDVLLFALLGVAMLVVLGRRVRMKDVRWNTALLFAGIAAVLQFLASLNEFPLALYDFDTTSSYGSFAGQSAAMAIVGALAFGGIIFLLTACSEPLYRESCPEHISIPHLLGWHSVRTRSFFRAVLAGVSLTFFFFAYEIGFYLLANKLGAWSPAEIPYTDLLNTKFPWISVLLGGFFPAVSEEWMFRAFSIPFLQKLLRRRWPAILLASFIWGFGHANYPNQPFFIRGIEVGIVGLVLSWAMFRFGILAPLIAHYSIDAFYSAFLFLRSGNPYLVTTGAVTAGINLIPLLVALCAYAVSGRFLGESAVSNRSEGTAAPAPAEAPPQLPAAEWQYAGLGRVRMYVGFLLLAAGLGLVMFLRPPRFGDFARFSQPPSTAEKTAREYLAGLGFDVRGYRSTTQPVNRVDENAAQYICSVVGIDGLNIAYEKLTRAAAWQTRFYRPLQKEEFRVNTDPASGTVISFRHLLAEDAAGADLPESRAQRIATSFLNNCGYKLSQFELKEIKSEKPRRRRDTSLVWEARAGSPGAIGEARLRVEADILGDRIGGWTHFIKVPEEWLRARERQTFYSIAALAVRLAFILAVFACAVLMLIRGIRQGAVRWKVPLLVAALGVMLALLDMVNSIPALMARYDTQWGEQVYLLGALVSRLIRLIGIGLASGLAAAVALACYPDLLVLTRRSPNRAWIRDAAAAAAAALGLLLLLQWIAAQIEYRAGKFALAPAFTLPGNLGTYLPLISSIRDVFVSSLFLSALMSLGVYLWTRAARRLWQRGLLLLGLIGSLLPSSARRVSEACFDLIPSLLLVGVACVLAVFFLRRNYLGYVLSAVVISVYRTSDAYLVQGNTALSVQGIVLWALVLAALFLLLRRPAAGQSLSP